ncbi:hypothetical protein PUMCH_000037 [Australozyma saopauloensis]|uniref:Protein kinase domain-containing protein n=1 Tax=Australozyma saopauloensis TaxID=291208 RepID=A0AAX4H3R4_9ASCO|nr:hypothetical protein PUMCH_000037 [[Candida] saopauloensis]
MKEFQTYKDINFYIPSRYKIEKCLGRGTYGVVCKAMDTKATEPIPLAIKKIGKILTKEVLMRRTIRELKLMRFFKGHPNVCESDLFDLHRVLIPDCVVNRRPPSHGKAI